MFFFDCFFRYWSKKYPICITLNKEHLNFDYVVTKDDLSAKSKTNEKATANKETPSTSSAEKKNSLTSSKKKAVQVRIIIFPINYNFEICDYQNLTAKI